jgi:hypothetical protein
VSVLIYNLGAETIISSVALITSCKCSLQAVGHPDGHAQFDNVLAGLLRCILDSNKRVQEAACSAFATLEEVLNRSPCASVVPYFVKECC